MTSETTDTTAPTALTADDDLSEALAILDNDSIPAHEALESALGNALPEGWRTRLAQMAIRDYLLASAAATADGVSALLLAQARAPVNRNDAVMQDFVGCVVGLDKAWRSFVRHTGKNPHTIAQTIIARKAGEPAAAFVEKVLDQVREADRQWMDEPQQRRRYTGCHLPRFNRLDA